MKNTNDSLVSLEAVHTHTHTLYNLIDEKISFEKGFINNVSER